MTGPSGAARVAGAAAALGAVVVLASACTTLPSDTPPAVVQEFSPREADGSATPPVLGAAPVDIVRGFLSAGARGDRKHVAARQYLTSGTSTRWDDTRSTTVVLRAEIAPVGTPTAEQASFAVRGDRVGVLGTGGVFRPEAGRLDVRLDLVREGGQWRIETPPEGVVIERADFFSTYARRDLYFLDRTGRTLVADPRWTAAVQDDLASSLVNLLVAGPRPELDGQVRSAVPASMSVGPGGAQPARTAHGGTAAEPAVLNFQGLGALGSQGISQFAAQVVTTLDAAKVPGPYRLERDGAPLDERRAAGWAVADVAEFGPPEPLRGPGLAVTPADGLVRLDDQGAGPAGGSWSAVRGARSGSRSWDGAAVAVVQGADPGAGPSTATLLSGPLTGTPAEVLRADAVTTPSWSGPDPVLWAVVDGARPVSVTTPSGKPAIQEVEAGGLRALGAPVTEFRVDSSGTRVAVVAASRVYVGVIGTTEGRPAVQSLTRIGLSLGDTVTAVDWHDPVTLVIGRNSPDAPVVTATVDGAYTEPLSQRNISAPILDVASSGARVYAVDPRSLVSLDTSADPVGRYWQDVPGLAAIRARPVATG